MGQEKNVKRNGSILWKHMTMMLSVLLLAVAALVVIYRMSLRTLTEENLTSMERSLARSCAQMENDIFITSSIPGAISGTEFYKRLQYETPGVLRKDCYPMLSFLRTELQKQLLLRGGSDLTVLYLPGVNSVISTEVVSDDAEDCFEHKIVLGETDTQTLLGYLRQRTVQRVLPMQPLYLDGTDMGQCLFFLSRAFNETAAVMSVYRQEKILSYFDLPNLPDGTQIKFISADGQTLMQYPPFPDEREDLQYYEMTFSVSRLGMKASFLIPGSYFRSVLQPVRRVGTTMILLVLVLGILMSFILSRQSVKPIRQLISHHSGEETERNTNELQSLDRMLSDASQRTTELNDRLSRQILTCILSGAAPSAADEEQLRLSSLLPSCFRVALIHAEPATQKELSEKLGKAASSCVPVRLNRNEVCFILPAAALEQVTQVLMEVNGALSCGISAAISEISDLLAAAHQARVSMPQRGVRIFYGESDLLDTLSWLQHERLYQSIFSGNQSEAESLLSLISQQANYANIRQFYYILQFILCSAAKEMGIELVESAQEYQANLTPQENMASLQRTLQELMNAIREQQVVHSNVKKAEVVEYVTRNASDSEMYAGNVAAHFNISTKRVYEAVRLATQMSFSEYLLSVRMKQAGKLLCNSQMDANSISRQCGYQSYTSFYRAFIKYYGITPRSFRQAGGVDPVGNFSMADEADPENDAEDPS